MVVGTSCSGKTTLARSLSRLLGLRHVELDALHWGPNWTPTPVEEFRPRVEAALSEPRWVCDGNYSAVRDLVWGRASTVIWLNYRFPRIFGRALKRTIGRAFTREELWSGNRESLAMAFFSKDSILWWVITSYGRRRREYPVLFEQAGFSHLEVVELRSPAATARFLGDVT